MLDGLSVVANGDDFLKANPTKIRIIGCGGGGSNSVRRMIQAGVKDVEFYVINTDLQALHNSPAPNRIPIGQKLTGGLGAGGNPEVGKAAAEEDTETLKELVTGANMVIVTAGMGGGTGTGSAPIVAKIAKEAGALTVAVVTTPFAFEAEVRMENAQNGIKKLRENVDSLIVIPNEQVYHLEGKKPRNMREAYIVADEVVCNGVTGITELITKETIPNLDFADVKTVMKDQGDAILGVGHGEGENRAVDAALSAISNPMLAESKIDGATKILICIESGCDDFSLTPEELQDIINSIKASASKRLELIYASVENEEITNDRLNVTVIATGFKNVLVDEASDTASSSRDDDDDVVDYDIFKNVLSGGSFEKKEKPVETESPSAVALKSAFSFASEDEETEEVESEKTEETSVETETQPVKRRPAFQMPEDIDRNDLSKPAIFRLSREINLTDDE